MYIIKNVTILPQIDILRTFQFKKLPSKNVYWTFSFTKNYFILKTKLKPTYFKTNITMLEKNTR